MKAKWYLIYIFFAAIISTSCLGADIRNIVGNVYAMTNSPIDNEVVVYGRLRNGKLIYFGQVSGGGLGGGDTDTPFGPGFDPVGAQDPLIMSEDGRYLYMANVVSDEISVFFLTSFGRPILIQTIDSGGSFPNSIELENDLVYVLNIGNGGRIATFRREASGRLRLIQEQTRELNLGTTGRPQGFDRVLLPGDLEIDPLRRRMMMTFATGGEDANSPLIPGASTGELWSWLLDDDGFISGEPHKLASSALGPFSVAYTDHGYALVAGTFTSTVTVYEYHSAGVELSPVSDPIFLPEQGAVCWIRITKNGFAYTTNTLSNAISQLRYTRSGELQLVNAEALPDIGQPVDFAITNDERYMYVATSTEGAVRAIQIDEETGELSSIGRFDGLPIFTRDGYAPAGLVVR